MIQTDDASGVRAAVEHLIDAGCRRVAYVEIRSSNSSSNRAETAAATLRARGITTVVVPSAEMGRAAAASLVRAIHDGVMPDGVLLSVDLVVRESTRNGPTGGGRG